MLCTYCSTPNPDGNRFCGECGQPLVRQQVTVPLDDPVLPKEHYPTSISGPSFLGLTDSSESDATEYLLEEDRPRNTHYGWFVFSAIATTILAVVGWLEWQAIRTGKLPVAGQTTTTAAEAPTTPATSTTAPSNSKLGESVSASPADAKPQSDGADDDIAPNETTSAKPSGKNPSSASAGVESQEKTSDAQATQESQSRLAKDAGQRREAAAASSDDSQSDDADDSEAADAAPEKPAPKPVTARTPRAPDPRQNPMLLSGERYLYGRGVRQDCNQALIYFRAAAESDNAPAMSHLGAMYASGHCVTPNRVAAYKWFARASA